MCSCLGRAALRTVFTAGLILAALAGLAPRPAAGQASVGFFEQRPFVVGVIPVVGRGGAVGGVSIDTQGAVARSTVEQVGLLRDARLKALAAVGGDLQAASRMRKISLRGLAAALERQRRDGLPPTDEMQNLAGLTRVEFVLVYPEQHDIVLAGPAEGWKVDDRGNVIGRTTGQPVLQLDDLIVALRSAREQPASGELITCSIDPTPEGLRRLARLFKSQGGAIGEATAARWEEALGPQQVTITGVPPGSHFARVLVAADFLMKRLGMNFEPAPVEGLPSYMTMLQKSPAAAPSGSAPRWWMAPKYEPLLRDADSLAWQLRAAAVETLTEEGRLGRGGAIVAQRAKDHSLAKKWADTMTARYDSLAAAWPALAELRSCMDLAVVGALCVKEDLPGRAGCDLGLLVDDKRLAVAEYNVPRTIDSRASLIRKDRQWIVSVSGGVEVDSWSALSRVEVREDLADVRAGAAPVRAEPAKPDRWWWD